ncbi:MAG: A24 family peptidase [Phycisphaerales bacterium]
MPELPPDAVILIARVFPLVFVAAWGACVGSLINVLAYRIPLGQSVVTPPSRCPACETRLTWRENIPVLGWLILRGRCRFCRSPISPEYPIVEAMVAGLFTLLVALWYVIPNQYGSGPVFLGIDWKLLQPPWAAIGPWQTWPYMVLILILTGCLAAMTIIDAKTYTIPLVLPWAATIAAIVFHLAHASYVQFFAGGHLPRYMELHPEYRWVIPTTGTYRVFGAVAGAVLGVGVSLLMLHFGLITRSFNDYDAWEQEALKADAPAGADAPDVPRAPAGESVASTESAAAQPASPGTAEHSPAQMWIQYPHARREMVKELAFLAPPAALGYVGFLLASWTWPAAKPLPDGVVGFVMEPHFTPLWLEALGGVLLGYLVGGGIVWTVRIGGSLAFGKEAMGMGDVHLLAAVGACVGWIYAVLAFFGAAFVGVAWALVSAMSGGKVQRAMPYGPFLAVATLLVLVFRPAILKGLNILVAVPEGGLPINFP